MLITKHKQQGDEEEEYWAGQGEFPKEREGKWWGGQENENGMLTK